jgi:uncharacterized protein YndB with AHSA1/START domain
MHATTNDEPTQKRTILERRSDRELVLTRTIHGPARLVFDAYTKPELLKRWWAPASMGVSMFSCEIDPRVGGRYRYAYGRDPKQQMAFSGTFTEVVPHERLVCTSLFEQMPAAGEAIVTTTFTERDGKTVVVLHQLFPSKQVMDGAIAAGMENGMRITMDQLEELVVALRG